MPLPWVLRVFFAQRLHEFAAAAGHPAADSDAEDDEDEDEARGLSTRPYASTSPSWYTLALLCGKEARLSLRGVLSGEFQLSGRQDGVERMDSLPHLDTGPHWLAGVARGLRRLGLWAVVEEAREEVRLNCASLSFTFCQIESLSSRLRSPALCGIWLTPRRRSRRPSPPRCAATCAPWPRASARARARDISSSRCCPPALVCTGRARNTPAETRARPPSPRRYEEAAIPSVRRWLEAVPLDFLRLLLSASSDEAAAAAALEEARCCTENRPLCVALRMHTPITSD